MTGVHSFIFLGQYTSSLLHACGCFHDNSILMLKTDIETCISSYS